jgi:DMSO/TMAO reductase YedYZ molybdopterin-dependent catalytic subunit
MKRNSFLLVLLTFSVLIYSSCTPAVALVAPSPSPQLAEPTSEPVSTIQEAGPVVLSLKGPQEELAFTMDELKALPAATGQAGMKSSTGKITVPALYKGVLLVDLVGLVGGISPELGINIVANDGYAMTLSYDQITNGNFIVYDPSDGSEKQIGEPLQVLVAYEMDGKPLDARRDGNLRLVIISPKNNQVTDGHWSVKWVERVEVQPLGKEWSLSLSGARQEVIDRNTFQSCGAASCHQSTWTDDEGQVWAGVPLYLLAGRMDDDITHDGPAYNRDLANAGYLIELIAADGYTTTIDSAAAFYNRDILVANQVNDSPLPDKYFPLRLVGEGLEKGQRIGALVEIRLIMEEVAATVTPVATAAPEASGPVVEPPAGTTLWITGQVGNSLALNDAALRALQVVKVTAEHPKKGLTEYEGVNLNALLNLAGLQAGASTLVLTAADEYTANVDLAAVQACPECLLAFTETEGVYNLVMPGFESSAWIKNVVKIEVK